MKLDSIRREYKFAELNRETICNNPLKQFEIWINDAIVAKVNEVTAMSLVTIGTDKFPQSRIVLLKDYNQKGLIFFTDYLSEKGKAIQKNPQVGIHFFWPELERQIRISGFAEKTSEKISDNYFYSRPNTSQIASIISNQSNEIPNREYLEKRFAEMQNSLLGQSAKRPKSWGGYLVKPEKIEFWQGRENRLHDRILYENKNGEWNIKRLAP